MIFFFFIRKIHKISLKLFLNKKLLIEYSNISLDDTPKDILNFFEITQMHIFFDKIHVKNERKFK